MKDSLPSILERVLKALALEGWRSDRQGGSFFSKPSTPAAKRPPGESPDFGGEREGQKEPKRGLRLLHALG
jgi:hypothetical protein